MGLAASQARFLALTARKADCEYRSMQLAQDKLSITRQLAEVTDEYQNSLNATKLCWDYNGQADNVQNLSYGLLMTPSEFNNYNPYIITDKTGKIILNDNYYKAADKAGIDPVNGSQRTDEGFRKFVEALAGSNIIDQSTKESIDNSSKFTYYQYKKDGESKILTFADAQELLPKLSNNNKGTITINGQEIEVAKNLTDVQIAILESNSKYTNGLSKIGRVYDADVGYGAEQLNKDYVSGNNKSALISKLRASLSDGNANLFKYSDSGTSKVSTLGGAFATNGDNLAITSSQVYRNGVQASDYDLQALDIGDLFTKNICLTGITKEQISDFIDNLANVNDGILFEKLIGSHTDETTKTAWYNALAIVKNRFTNKVTTVDQSNADSEARKYNSLCKYGNGENDYSVSLSNILSCLLTQFEININGTDNGYYIGEQTTDSSFVTSDENYLYTLNNPDTVTDKSTLKTDFYMQLYNNLCINGYRQDGTVSDNDKLESKLRNGTYFITNIRDDSYFYQSRYNEADCVIEVKDEDAIAQAEAEFEAQKAKLEYKEETIDLDMKNLDAEISSISTEHDSVKNLISKNIEKIFNQFQ